MYKRQFQYNVVRRAGGGFNLLGYDSPNQSRQTRHIRIRHNLLYDITRDLGGQGWFMLIGDEPRDVIVDHNTADIDGSTAVSAYGGTASDPRRILEFQFTNNAMPHRSYGLNASGHSYGNGTIAAYYPDGIVRGNWLPGGAASRYPAGNLFGGTFGGGFVDAGARDYRAAPGGLLPGAATDGTDIGADMGRLLAGIAGVAEGMPGSRPVPPVTPVPGQTPSGPRNLRVVTR